MRRGAEPAALVPILLSFRLISGRRALDELHMHKFDGCPEQDASCQRVAQASGAIASRC